MDAMKGEYQLQPIEWFHQRAKQQSHYGPANLQNKFS